MNAQAPLVLAVDCSSEHGSLALTSGDRLLAEAALHAPDGFAHLLFGEIEALLRRHSLSLPEVDAFAAANGPGSFTGIRVAVSAMKGLADALNRPVFGVSNLAAIAWFGAAPLRAVLLDARRAEVYAAVYDEALSPVLPETVGKLNDFLRVLPDSDRLEILDPDSCLAGVENLRLRAGRQPLARAVAHIAGRRFSAGERPGPAGLDANYVRRSDAELHWRES